LAKPAKSTQQTNFAKEPFCPSRSNPGQTNCDNLIDHWIENINRQCLTRLKQHRAEIDKIINNKRQE